MSDYIEFISQIDREIQDSDDIATEEGLIYLQFQTGVFLTERVRDWYKTDGFSEKTFNDNEMDFSKEYLLSLGKLIFDTTKISLRKSKLVK